MVMVLFTVVVKNNILHNSSILCFWNGHIPLIKQVELVYNKIWAGDEKYFTDAVVFY